MHPREVIIRAMTRMLIVESFADWAEEDENADAAEPYVARGGQDWMDTTPAMSPACQEAALIEAAILYGCIKQSWGMEPWVLVQRHADKHGASGDGDGRGWGSDAVMTCLGHGVAWEDDHPPLASLGKTYTLSSRHEYHVPRIESLDWEWVDEVRILAGTP